MEKSAICISTQVLAGNKIEIQTPDLTVGEVVEVIIISQKSKKEDDKDSSDPLIGLFQSSPDLATQSEDILHQEIQENSGWTWKDQ